MKRRLVEYRHWRAKALKDPAVRKAIEEGDDDPVITIAMQIIHLRKKHGLTQAQLARKLGTSQQAVARMESLDYAGYSIKVLSRVAEALNKRLSVRFV